MGIRGLLTFMEKYCDGAYEEVNIPEIAEKYKRETGLDPIIALDISSCIREIYKKNQINLIDSERFKIFEEAVNKFLKSFTDLGIKFYVVFDGVAPETKLPVWISRKKELTNTISKIMYTLKISNGEEMLYFDDREFVLPYGAETVLNSIFESNKNCTCRFSVGEADEELANYAVNNNCFAYLTADSDFVIYGGAKYCLSIRHLNLEKMTTINLNRDALAKALKMDVKQLPIFALLCGTDVIPYDVVKYFHRELCPGYMIGRIDYRIQFQAIANFVKKLPHGRDILKKLPEISKKVFKTEEYAGRLEAGLKSYWGDLTLPAIPKIGHEIWDKILKKCQEKHVAFLFESIIYNVLFGYSIKLGPLLENVNDGNIPPSVLTTLPLRKSLYGILLYEKPNREEIHIQESQAFSPNSLDKPFKIKPEFIEHPGLLTLWDENDQSEETVEARWRTFCKAVSPKLNYQEIMILPKNLILPLLALFYLRNELKASWDKYKNEIGNKYTFKLEDFEIKALLTQFLVVNESTIDEIDKTIKFFESYKEFWNFDTKAVNLGSVFQNVCRVLYSISVACGNLLTRSEASASKYYDWKLFMRIYNVQKGGNFDTLKCFTFKREIRENYEKYLNFIMNTD